MADPATRPYRIEIPNLVDDLDLSVYAFRLYVHIKRVAGPSGTCYEGARRLAEKCRMSPSKVAEAKQELLDKGLITRGKRHTNGGETDELTPVDLWAQNFQAFSKGDRCAITMPEGDRNAITGDRQEITREYGATTPQTADLFDEGDRKGDRTAIKGDRTAIERINHEERTYKNKTAAPRAPRAGASPDHARLMQLFAAEQPDGRIPDGGACGQAAKSLLAGGYTPEQAIDAYHALKAQPFYRNKYVSLTLVNREIGTILNGSSSNGTSTRSLRSDARQNPERARWTTEDHSDIL